MGPKTRIHDFLLWGLLIATGLGVAAWAAWPRLARFVGTDSPIHGTIADFDFQERSCQPITRETLEGKVWIVGFFFSRCRMSCPQIIQAMSELQEELRPTDVVLVSLSVDPDHDTPEVLRRYADAHQADAECWLFLTGDQGAIYQFIEKSFQTRPLEDAKADPGMRIAHSNRLFLVDRQGQVRGGYLCVEEMLDDYSGPTGLFQVDQRELKRLRHDAADLAAGRFIRLSSLPTVNAVLNGTSAILLVLGFLCIRRRLMKPHIVCMAGAVIVSALFLASYLYYHFHQGRTEFTAQGWIRPVYFGILLSHTILAVVVVPLVMWTLYRAVRGQFDRHRCIARWTLPIWLYVSVTGVLVYLFLYHFFAG